MGKITKQELNPSLAKEIEDKADSTFVESEMEKVNSAIGQMSNALTNHTEKRAQQAHGENVELIVSGDFSTPRQIILQNIPQTYRSLRLSLVARANIDSYFSNLGIILNDDTNVYDNQNQRISGSNVTASVTSNNPNLLLGIFPAIAADERLFGCADIEFLNYSNDRFKTISYECFGKYGDAQGETNIGKGFGTYKRNSAINKITFTIFLQQGYYALYGVRG